MNKLLITSLTCALTLTSALHAQTEVTNAFDDLRRAGSIHEQASEMCRIAPEEAVKKLLRENPAPGYFCFTEDRAHDIRLTDAIPLRWAERPAAQRNQFNGSCQPGEFYNWQIGIYAPYKELQQVSLTFSDLKNERGERIKASSLRCFNLGGTDTHGKEFSKNIDIPRGNVQPLWIGIKTPESASGTYQGTVTVKTAHTAKPTEISVALTVTGDPIPNQGDNEGWRKTRLHWLDSPVGHDHEPTAPYIPVRLQKQTISWLGGTMQLSETGLPQTITTRYDGSNQLSPQASNPVLAAPMQLVVETESGQEIIKPGSLKITHSDNASIHWTVKQSNRKLEIQCDGTFGFDGLVAYQISVRTLQNIQVKDIRLEVPYTPHASRYMMGLGHKGGFRPDSLISWQWDVSKHQDKIWMGNVNAGLNFCFRDENYIRPLVNVYYDLGKLNLPASWGNHSRGGIRIAAEQNDQVLLTAYSGERDMLKGEVLHYNFNMLITPVKPLDMKGQATERFYHSNSDLSTSYITEALKNGANMINVHHKKDIYPFINYPYYDDAVPDLKRFISDAHKQNLDVRLYYTTRELTVKIPELWALRSLGNEIIHDGPGKDARTLIHQNGPHEWLNKNLATHFIPAWYNAFQEGKYAGDMDLSVITAPDSRWNNYYLEGLNWMIQNLGADGVYIDDSALDHKTLQRARRILDADGKRRLIDIHSWNHMNEWAGYANSLHLYLELLPYVDRTWIGEGFEANNTSDFWLVEMSGIPFGLMSETLDARNTFRGMIYGMLPRLPWSGNPVPLWQLWDSFGMKEATIKGYWDELCPVKTNNAHLPATVYLNGDKALVVIANWTDLPQTASITLDEKLLGFTPTSFKLPEIRNMQWEGKLPNLKQCKLMGQSGMVILLEKE